MVSIKSCVATVCVFFLTLALASADDKAATPPKINWVTGPTNASLKDIAEIQVPVGYKLANPKDTRMLLEGMGNPTSGSELGLLAPTSTVWFVVFEYDPSGYIKDDDKDNLDPEAMLKAIKKGNERGNEARKKMGAPMMTIVGWEQPPKYNPDTHNLEWAIRGESEGSPVVNYNTRLLGRKGVMEVSLVVDPEKLAATMPEYQALLTDYNFKSGERYAEYRQGDKVAKYGLAALVTGGAAVVAVKTGLFASLLLIVKKAWKLLIVAIAGIVGFFKKLIKGNGQKPSV